MEKRLVGSGERREGLEGAEVGEVFGDVEEQLERQDKDRGGFRFCGYDVRCGGFFEGRHSEVAHSFRRVRK